MKNHHQQKILKNSNIVESTLFQKTKFNISSLHDSFHVLLANVML